MISVYDLLGREIKILVDEYFHAGAFRSPWNGMTTKGEYASSGIYYYRFVATTYDGSESFQQIRKMMLTK